MGAVKYHRLIRWDGDIDLQIHPEDWDNKLPKLASRIAADGFFLRKHETSQTQYLLQANSQNYLLIELNKRVYDQRLFDDDQTIWIAIDGGRLVRAAAYPHKPLTRWYGPGYLANRLRHVPEWEELKNPLYCGTLWHHNCVRDVTPAVPM